ncbi:LysR family transcriptional regulator [Rhodovarius crocodyli]|uniref:LysR family transcriptional regulator n=1 Tax=Rhodovarius crocodyli TaxID=1979269 RepID=A0A437MD52_9PROT|nr:LysR family transcriptional regulator [Rhodovarius crocodyli]RVT95562.1 LysR family transcriptional regulator [Rhodovarius crocodyli]
MLDIRDLQRIQAIATHGNFTRAARVLGVTQPALTRSISAVEAMLRGPLFLRSRQGAEPTDMCRMILADAPSILERMEALQRNLSELRSGPGQEIAVASGPYPFETILLPAAIAFGREQPRIRLRMEIQPWPRAVAQLRAGLVEIALANTTSVVDLAGLSIEPLPAHPMLAAVRAGHPLLRLKRPELSQILAYPLVTTANLSANFSRMLTEARAEARARRPHPAFPAMMLEPMSAWLSVVRRSDAVAFVTAPALEEPGAQVEVLRFQSPVLRTSPAIMRLASRAGSRHAGQFIEALRAANAQARERAWSMFPWLDQR